MPSSYVTLAPMDIICAFIHNDQNPIQHTFKLYLQMLNAFKKCV